MKYKLTDETIRHGGRTLYRIQALKDFGNVKAGDLGGYIESEINLSHDGDCWVADNALVFGNAEVFDNALVSDNARVSDDARVYGNALVYGNVLVSNNTWVYGNTQIKDGFVG